MSLLFAQPNQLYLEILPENQDRAWRESQKLTNSASMWRAYLNRLLLDSFCFYLTEEYSLQPQVAHPEKLQYSWSLLDGTVISIKEQRLVLLPTEAIDDDEVRIPQEWIDIPSWVADYYVVAEVNPDQQWMRMKGYTTHALIFNQGSYDVMTREYSLHQNQLIEDLSILWLSQEFYPAEVTTTRVDLLTNLAPQQAENLIQRLGNSEVVFPRLEVPFSLWGALLENKQYLQKLAQLREGQEVVTNPVTKLTNWLENIFDNLWQAPENFHLASAATRSFTSANLKRSKLIDIDNQPVILLLEISAESNEKLGVKIELYPEQNNRYLPANIKLSLLSAEGETLKSTQARSQDNYIAINKFKAPKNFEFKIEIQLNLAVKVEEFIV